MIDTAFIFAAGKGTRLAPITHTIPKCLVPVLGQPMLYHTIKKVEALGIKNIVINVHHFADQIIQYLDSGLFKHLNIRVSIEKTLLETGGGLLKAKSLLKTTSPFIVLNSDVYSDIDLGQFIRSHDASNLASLAIAKRKSSRQLFFDRNKILTGWINKDTGEKDIINEDGFEWAFQGIHIISPRIFPFLETFDGSFSLIPAYLKAMHRGEIMKGFDTCSYFWCDIGTPEKLKELNLILENR
jgi:NDP-sugar pyrophosphorylase family protein